MPSPSELHYRWQWELGAAPAALWPLVSNTDLFNRDCGLPPVEVVPPAERAAKPAGRKSRRTSSCSSAWPPGRPGPSPSRSPRAGGPPRVFRVALGAPAAGRVELGARGDAEVHLAPAATLQIANPAAQPCRVLIEHLAWTDQAATAAEVTALQLFRDLFASEVLRPGEQISVGHLAVVFTDLKGSTRMYREIGDAPAFGRVLTHFEVLKAAVAAEGGAVVKTMGDAIMAVFPRPVAALRALVSAQQRLARPQAADAVPPPTGGAEFTAPPAP